MTSLNLRDAVPPDRELRESYTEQQVAAAVASATGTAASGLTATVEAICFWWERAFSAGRSEALSPWQLGRIGRELVLHGDSVWWLSRRGLVPVAQHTLIGDSAAPTSWRYTLTIPSPTSTVSRTVSADRVLHVRIGASRNQPWRGCSPLANATATRDLLSTIERSLLHEHKGPVGHVIAVPDPEGSTAVADEIGKLEGRTVLGEASEMDLPGEGQGGRTNWNPHRIGPAPEASTTSARQDIELSLAGSCGLPGELVRPQPGADPAAAFRRFVASTIEPVSALVSAELRRLGLASEIDFAPLRAADLQARTRSYKQLRESNFPESEARRICGLT